MYAFKNSCRNTSDFASDGKLRIYNVQHVWEPGRELERRIFPDSDM